MFAGLGTGLAVSLIVALTACTGDDSQDGSPPEPTARAQISATVPPERLTPFCQAMIDLTAQIRAGDVDDAGELILDTYRRIADDAPNAIVDDFHLVLAALEAGEPPPTDPPRDTVPVAATTPRATTPAATSPVTSSSTTSVAADGSVVTGSGPATSAAIDEAFAPGDSPSERINSYVDFECRDTANNPGPAPTQPLAPPDDGG